MVDLIEKKREGQEFTKEEIDFFIQGYTKGEIPEYQMSSLMMAIYFQGMTVKESTDLALSMLHSGDVVDLSSIDGVKVDKHSTGGVGDKTTLVLAPLLASVGVKVAKMSGRGLGHTGGTLDKLESISGFQVTIPNEQFVKQVNQIGLAVIGQTANLAPADKKLYALRDVTGTVPSIPLIASSIMSKKLASGADAICLDVKVGSGAFMKTIEDAKKLAVLMVNIGKSANKKITAVITNMDEPLGYAIGNSLEVIEAINTLNGNGPSDLEDLCLEIASRLTLAAGVEKTIEDAKIRLRENLYNRKALDKLIEMVEWQKGNKEYIKNVDSFPKAKEIIEIKSKQTGYVSKIDSLAVGISASLLGAGRNTKEESIDPSVGIILVKKVSDFVEDGECLAYLHTNGKNTNLAHEKLFSAFEISDEKKEPKLIIDIIE